MQSDYYINLHFNQAVSQRTGYAFKIGDKGCTFHLHCEDLDPTGMLPHIVFNHPNNTCVEGVPDGSGRDYTYTIQGNEFGVCGKTVVDLKFYNSLDATQRISTASFMIEIIPDTYTPFEEASSSYADSLERAREEIDAAILDLQGAEHDLEEAETDLGNMSEQFADTLQDYIDAFGNTAPINPRGAYDDEEEYVPRDAVAYTAGGKTLTYINKQACTGIAPTDPDEGAAHWQIMIDVSVGGSFSALSDVNVDPQTLTDGQVPVYDATGEVWENKTILEDSLTSTATDKALTAAKGKELQDNKQDKELETALTINGTQQTTVESALGGLNGYVDDVEGAAFNVYGSKNLNAYPYDETTKSTNGITFTDNGNGTVTVSGTAEADVQFICHNINLKVNNGTYKLLGCPAGGSFNNGYSIYCNWYQSQGVPSTTYVDEGTGANVTINGSVDSADFANITIVILVKNGTAIATPLTFKPMICDEHINDKTFAPFAKTNLQLTADKAERKDLTTIFATGTTNNTGAQIAAGKFFYLNGVYCKAKTNIAADATFTFNTNFEVATVGEEVSKIVQTDDFGHGVTKVFAAKRGCLIIISRQSDGIFFIGQVDVADTVSNIVSVGMNNITITYSAGTVSIINQSGTAITATVIGG